MGLFARVMLAVGADLPKKAGPAQGLHAALGVESIATNADLTLTVAQISKGIVQFTSFSAGRAVTTPTAALILAAAPDMDVGDSFSFIVSCVAAFAATWTAGVGVTLSGRATTPASSWSIVTVTKTSATTVTWNVT